MVTGTHIPSRDNILVVTDQLPFPPRNGITLPIYNYLIGLKKNQKVELLLLVDQNSPPSTDELEKNKRLFGEIRIVCLTRQGYLTRLWGEVIGSEMYQHGWRISEEDMTMDFKQIGTVIVSPMSAVAKWRSSGLSNMIGTHQCIAAVNDCTTAEYFFRGQQSFGGFKLAIKSRIDHLRSYQIARIEAKLLAPYQYILLQTRKDQELMRKLVSRETASRVAIVPNGVQSEYFLLDTTQTNESVLFVAELSGEYAAIASWLVSDLWPEVIRRIPECQLNIVGKGASDELIETIKSTKHVSHITFVEDLGQLYGKSMVVLSPVFKGYGLINKSLEAMAASIAVVGGEAAFNGIEGFQSGTHGIACKTRSVTEFADAITNLIMNPAQRIDMGTAARELLNEQFRWEFSVVKLQSLIARNNQ